MIKEFLAGLQPRERQLVIGAAVLLIVFMAYLLLWRPYGGKRLHDLQASVSEQRATLAWMQQAAVRAQQLRGNSAIVSSGGQSLMALIDQTAKGNDLSAAMKRVEPAGEHSVRVWIEQAPFDTLVTWLDILNRSHGVHVQTITMDREAAGPGRVNARITLEGAGA